MIDSWAKELIQGTVAQEIIYYAISYEESSVHDVYDESIRKEYMTPIRINARVEFEQVATNMKDGHLDSNYTLAVSCHADELRDRNVNPREGDFIEYGQKFFEVSSIGTIEPTFGQINNKLTVKLTCVPSREGQFKADSSTIDGVDNSHPVEHARPTTLGDDL